MTTLGRVSQGGVLYVRPEIEVFRGIERFSDYKKTRDRVRRALDQSTGSPRGRRQRWRFLLSDKGLTAIIAIGTVVLVLIGVATLIVTIH